MFISKKGPNLRHLKNIKINAKCMPTEEKVNENKPAEEKKSKPQPKKDTAPEEDTPKVADK